nr:hypothetical protein [Tanacetum cinerariifolium]
MDANKKIDLDNPLCLNERKILANIFHNHPLRFDIAASSSVPWIYLKQFWHTLKEDGSKYRLSFMLDRKELTMTLDDFRMIFQPPQATDNNHKLFKSHDNLEAKQNEEKVKEHLMADEIEKLVEGTEKVGEDEVDNSIFNSHNDFGTRLAPMSYKESPEVEKNIVSQPVNVIEKEDKSTKDDYELRRNKKGKEVISSTLCSSDIGLTCSYLPRFDNSSE